VPARNFNSPAGPVPGRGNTVNVEEPAKWFNLEPHSNHVAMVSHRGDVVRLIETAAEALMAAG
jgi:hypothetical protein